MGILFPAVQVPSPGWEGSCSFPGTDLYARRGDAVQLFTALPGTCAGHEAARSQHKVQRKLKHGRTLDLEVAGKAGGKTARPK